MIFSNILFIAIFTIVMALIAYLAANERSYARPQHFFIAALVSIILGYGFASVNGAIETRVKGIQDQAQLEERESERLRAESKHLEDGPQFLEKIWLSTPDVLSDWRSKEIERRLEHARKLRAEADSITAVNAPLKSISDLMLLISGAFAGALASAAITNRAKFRHDARALDFMRMTFAECEFKAQGLASSIKKSTSMPSSDPKMLTEVNTAKSELSGLLKEMELLSAYITQKELEDFEVMATTRRVKPR